MNISISRQSPIAALLAMTVFAVIGYVRFAVAPYGNEVLSAAHQAPVAEWLSGFEHRYPTVSIAAAALLTIITGAVVGRMSNRFRLYNTQCFLSMPVYAFGACGIFISSEPLTSAATALSLALALQYLGIGYLRGQDLSAMLYGGLCIGAIPMLSAPVGAAMLLLAIVAIPMLSLSFRELVVLMVSILFIPAAVCYGVWALGGDFTAPLTKSYEALVLPSEIQPFGEDAVAALLLSGLIGYAAVCSVAIFVSRRFGFSLKSRGILIYIITAGATVSATLALPCATPSLLSAAAVPLSAVIPVMFVRIDERMSLLLYTAMILAFGLHLWVL